MFRSRISPFSKFARFEVHGGISAHVVAFDAWQDPTVSSPGRPTPPFHPYIKSAVAKMVNIMVSRRLSLLLLACLLFPGGSSGLPVQSRHLMAAYVQVPSTTTRPLGNAPSPEAKERPASVGAVVAPEAMAPRVESRQQQQSSSIKASVSRLP